MRTIVTSESVGEGHPDKVCDQISDAVLDTVLRSDPKGRVACETYITRGLIVVGGEITTDCYVDIPAVVEGVLKRIGYTSPKYGFDYHTCGIISAIHRQSTNIAMGVDKGGAGDQGFVVGYACDETPDLMPMPIMLAHAIVKELAYRRRSGEVTYLGPDCKSQVSVEYEGSRPVRVASVVIACQHTEEALDATGEVMTEHARQEIKQRIKKILPLADEKTEWFINNTGVFLIGGPQSDTGMTGRKLTVDTYGGVVPHGGGAFSGKDPTKIDRSGAYMCRWLARNIVAAGIAKSCMVQAAYAIGRAHPLNITVKTVGEAAPGSKEEMVVEHIAEDYALKFCDKMSVAGMIDMLKLRTPIYEDTACYGHFGRDRFTWEQSFPRDRRP